MRSDLTHNLAAPSCSLLLPTLNEMHSLPHILSGISKLKRTADSAYSISEIIILDGGSTDATRNIAHSVGELFRLPVQWSSTSHPPESLAQSLLRGLNEAREDICLFMDSDGSHPTSVLPHLIDAIHSGAAITIASRFTDGGSMQKMSFIRQGISRTWAHFSRPFTGVTDPLSGCAALNLTQIRLPKFAPQGFKLLPEILRINRDVSVSEVPYAMKRRRAGESKLDLTICFAMLKQWIRWVGN